MRRLILRSALPLLVLTSIASAQPPAGNAPPPAVNPALFQGLRYRLVGPMQGGRVTPVTGVPSQPRTFYMGVASGGVFKTVDAGETWFPVTDDGQVPVGSIGDIAVSLSNPDVVYIGTGSDGVRSNVSTGRGVYRSNDAGRTWSFAGLYNVGQIGAVRIHPTNADIAWVAANGDMFKPNSERGIFKTTDGGRSWKNTLFLNDSTGAMDVELQPGNPDVVYAWMSRIERKPWTIISGSREGGFFKSTDGGETFRSVGTGLPGELIGKGNLAVSAADPNRIYALVEALPGGGMYRSDDAGQTWQALPSPGGMIQRPFYYTTLGADPTNADVVYGGAEGFWRSRDGGQTWQSLRTPHGDNHDIWVSPNDGNVMVQANDGGANVSTDAGATWTTQDNQPTSEIYGIWLDDRFPYRIYGAQQDDGTHIISSMASGGERNEDWWSGPGCETGPLMPHPGRNDIVYGSCKGQYEVRNMETGVSRRYWIGGQSLYGNDARDLILRFQRVSPMETSPHDPDILYYGSQHVHRTRDMGRTWETISPDLTANPPCCQGGSGEPITRDVTGEEFYSTLYQIRESLHEPGVIWTGANDGPFHITRDNGANWTNITPPDMPEGGRVQIIEPSPHRPGSAYYATHRYLLGDYKPYIYRTDDYGRTWSLLTDGTNGIPADWPARVIREDPDREGLLYAGTEFGLFISFDNGRRWQPFQLNMPNTPITDMKVYRKDLVISTQGRAIWILDNVSSLHQMATQTSLQQPNLYKPRDGYRALTNGNLLGPMIEYHLPTVPQGPVVIDILDQAGNLVNSYSSDAPVAAAGGGRGRGGRGGGGGGGRGGRGGRGGGGGGGGGDPVDPDAAMMVGRVITGTQVEPVVARVTKDIGHNRFVWDVVYENGLSAPPGAYQARLKVGSASQTQPFNLLVDPRIAQDGVTAQDLRVLFEYQTNMRTLTADMNQIAQRVEQAHDRLVGATGAAADTARRVQALFDRIFDVDVRYGQPGLSTHVRYLNGMVRGDMHPGNQALERFAVLRREVDQMRADVNQVLGPGGPGGPAATGGRGGRGGGGG